MVDTKNTTALKSFWDHEPELMQDLEEEIYEDLGNSYVYGPAAFPSHARFETFIKETRGWNDGGMAQELSKMNGQKDRENQHLDCFMLLHLGCETNNDKIRKRDTMSKCLSAAGA